MHWDEIRNVIGYILAGLIAMIAWLGKREIKRLDDNLADHELRMRRIEDVASKIMTEPQVMAIYSEQRKDNREKFSELRQDHKELRIELSNRIDKQSEKLDLIIARIVNREPNERRGDE